MYTVGKDGLRLLMRLTVATTRRFAVHCPLRSGGLDEADAYPRRRRMPFDYGERSAHRPVM